MKSTRKNVRRNDSGPQIRKLRLAAKPAVTQDDLAGRVAARGVLLDRSAISRIESQDRYPMDYELIAIARSLKVPPGSLLPEK